MEHASDEAETRPLCAVIGPLSYLTVTVEQDGEREQVHLHPGGQGVWIARVLSTSTTCTPSRSRRHSTRAAGGRVVR